MTFQYSLILPFYCERLTQARDTTIWFIIAHINSVFPLPATTYIPKSLSEKKRRASVGNIRPQLRWVVLGNSVTILLNHALVPGFNGPQSTSLSGVPSSVTIPESQSFQTHCKSHTRNCSFRPILYQDFTLSALVSDKTASTRSQPRARGCKTTLISNRPGL